jgi:hypothetical protein
MGVADLIPNLHSFRSYGETGYVHREQRQKGAKFDGRAVSMHFVGREGSWIYLMWDPQTCKINRSSSVAWASHQIEEIPRTQPVQQADDYYRPQPLSIPVPAADFTSAPPPPLAEQSQPSLIQPPPTPPLVQEPGGDAPGGDASGSDAAADNLKQGSGFDFNALNPPSHEAPRHLDISSPIDEQNIITGTRNQHPTQRYLAVAKVTAKLAHCFASALIDTLPAVSLPSGIAAAAGLPPEPVSHKQALYHPFKDGWLKAEGVEYQAHEDNNTWTIAKMPAGVFPLPTKWVYNYKLTDDGELKRLKACLVVCGNRQDLDHWRETYAAVARATTLKVLLALVAALDLECDQADVTTAFLNGVLDDAEIVYIRLPDSRMAHLNKALYGLRRSPRLWYEELSRHLKAMEFLPIEADPCVFLRKQDGSLILACVDDIIFITRSCASMRNVKEQFFGKYKCRNIGPIFHYLGICVRRDRSACLIELSMEPYNDKLIQDFKRVDSFGRLTPFDTSTIKLTLSTAEKIDSQLLHNYQTIIGKLLYPATQLRIDIAIHVGFLARALAKPTPQHYNAALNVVDYLKSAKDLVMTYKAPTGPALAFEMFSKALFEASPATLGLHAYSDASFADAENRKSTSGYLFKLAGGTVCHKSVKQKLVTTSTTEAKYVAMTYAAKEAAWLHRLLHQVGYVAADTHPIHLYGDNEPSIKLLTADGHHERTKHVDIYYHYIRDCVKDSHLTVSHVRTHEMAADSLTKPLDRHGHAHFLSHVGLSKPTIVATTRAATQVPPPA